MKLACPACARVFSPEDINVQTDLALCRGCGRIARPSELSDTGTGLDEAALRHPPKGAWYRQTPTETVIGATTRHGIAFFLLPFACVWSGGALGGIYGSQIRSGEFNLLVSLFGLPFLIGSVFLWSITLMAIGGKVEVRLRGRQGGVFVGIGPVGWKRPIDLDATEIIAEDTRYGRRPGNATTAIELRGRSPLRFGSQLNETRRSFLLQALRLHKTRKG